MEPVPSIAVIGAGEWGTALACLAAANGQPVCLWTRSAAFAATLNRDRAHPALPGFALPTLITATAEPAALATAPMIALAVPAQALRAAATALAPQLDRRVPAVLAAKGIEQVSGSLMHQVLAETLPHAIPVVLSGPGFAEDIVAGLPAAVAIAAPDAAAGNAACAMFARPAFRPYLTDDIVGAQIGGAVKNVLAIAAGIVIGRGLGESARAALIARGLAEMTRLGVALGGRRETFAGLSGLGDLVLTATSAKSRNTAFGLALGAGRALAEISGPGAPLVEGAHSAGIVTSLALRHGIDMPIAAAVAEIVAGGLGIGEAIGRLLDRPLTRE